jgi:hypothetical protein
MLSSDRECACIGLRNINFRLMASATTLQHIPVSAHHVRAPSKILAMLPGAQTLTGVGGDLILDKHYYGIRTAQIQTRYWGIF